MSWQAGMTNQGRAGHADYSGTGFRIVNCSILPLPLLSIHPPSTHSDPQLLVLPSHC